MVNAMKLTVAPLNESLRRKLVNRLLALSKKIVPGVVPIRGHHVHPHRRLIKFVHQAVWITWIASIHHRVPVLVMLNQAGLRANHETLFVLDHCGNRLRHVKRKIGNLVRNESPGCAACDGILIDKFP